MKSSKILEGNKLIAEYMEFINNGNMYQCCFDNINRYCDCNSMNFDTSYDWVMPVVEKIENFNHSSTLVIIEDERCHIDSQNGFEVDSVGSTKREAIYNAVVEFIKWYNLNK